MPVESSHFNEDGAEGQDAPERDDDPGFHEPLLLRDGSGDGVNPARVVGVPREVPPQHRPHQVQGQDHEGAQTQHRQLQGNK